jgi:hypothetical protein
MFKSQGLFPQIGIGNLRPESENDNIQTQYAKWSMRETQGHEKMCLREDVTVK